MFFVYVFALVAGASAAQRVLRSLPTYQPQPPLPPQFQPRVRVRDPVASAAP